MISLCVCVYNSEHYLDDLFKSFIKQTRKDFKVLVVDNNSTDNSIEVISKYKNCKRRETRNSICEAKSTG